MLSDIVYMLFYIVTKLIIGNHVWTLAGHPDKTGYQECPVFPSPHNASQSASRHLMRFYRRRGAAGARLEVGRGPRVALPKV